jgi:carbon storage regulator
MLVLSRKLGEKIHIGDQICITIVDIDRGKIRLGIEAPRDVPIFRQELLTGNKPAPEGAVAKVVAP